MNVFLCIAIVGCRTSMPLIQPEFLLYLTFSLYITTFKYNLIKCEFIFKRYIKHETSKYKYFTNCLPYVEFSLYAGKRFADIHKISLLCSSRLHLFDQKYRKKTNLAKCYYNMKEWFLFSHSLKI